MAYNKLPDTGYCPPKPRSKPFQMKRGKSRAWMRYNPVLLCGEPGYEIDTHKMKVGDGKTPWRLLPYIGDHRKPKDGKSAYQIWLEAGNRGTVEDFLNSLVGEQGKSTYEIWLSLGNEGTVEDFIEAIKGETGKSAYEIWLELGYTGTEEDFMDWLRTTTWDEF